MKLQEGDNLDISVEEDKIVIKPVLLIDRSQSWFWSKKWQAMETEAEENIRCGNVRKAKNLKELIRKLED